MSGEPPVASTGERPSQRAEGASATPRIRSAATSAGHREDDATAPSRRTAAYTRIQIVLHWFVAALVLEQYATSGAIVRPHTMHLIGQHQNPTDFVLHTMHNRLGLIVTALMMIRLVVRLYSGPPAPMPARAGGARARRLASTVHAAFYGVLICEGAAGAVATYLWWPASALHVALFEALIVLIVLHVAAVAVHHLSGAPVLGRMGLRWIPALRLPRPSSRENAT